MSKTHTMPCGNSVTNTGDVYSRLGRKLRQHVSSVGYFRVELWSGGRGQKVSVHRLVAQAFVENPHGKPQVNHLDGDKLNNAACNLEWVTQSENQRHAYEVGLQKGYHVSGQKLSPEHKAALCGSRWVGQTRTYHAEGLTFISPKDAACHFGLNRQTFYNRANSEKFPTWKIKVRREEK